MSSRKREKIRDLLHRANISSMDDIQNLFRETIAEFIEDGLDNEYRPIRTALGVCPKSEIAPRLNHNLSRRIRSGSCMAGCIKQALNLRYMP